MDPIEELKKAVSRVDELKALAEKRSGRTFKVLSWLPPVVIIDCMPTGSLTCFFKPLHSRDTNAEVLFGGVSLTRVPNVKWPEPGGRILIRELTFLDGGSWNLILRGDGTWWVAESALPLNDDDIPQMAGSPDELRRFKEEGWFRREYQIDLDGFFQRLFAAATEKAAA
jgi:hypothetical protein